jgi:ribosomal protein L37AE/L43A
MIKKKCPECDRQLVHRLDRRGEPWWYCLLCHKYVEQMATHQYQEAIGAPRLPGVE